MRVIYGILDHVFQILDTEDAPVKQIMSSLAILLQKSENELPTSSKNHIILWEKLKITWKKNKWPWKIISRCLWGRERRKGSWACVGVFCQNLGITAYTLENYSNFKSKFSFNNGNNFETYDYFRTYFRGNARFNDLVKLIESLLNQDFAGLDKLENLFRIQGVATNLNWRTLKKRKL